MKIEGNLVDVLKEEIYPARIKFNEKILAIEKTNKKYKNYILPGFIDSHIHIESSLLTPSRFAEVVVKHGTTCVIADPHEIANVLGMKGIKYMIADSKSVPLKIFFTAPSCVPATEFESAGARLNADEIEKLMRLKEIVALGEVMNFPGVINEDPALIEKIKIAKKYKKPIDGHAPKLSGKNLAKYISFGISTDHECTSYAEAKEKAEFGMRIMIREGSSAKDMKNLIEITKEYQAFFVTDDMHASDLIKGHMNKILQKAVNLGLDPIKAIKCVTLNPALHYNLNSGYIAIGKQADIVEVSDLKNFKVKRVFVNGKLVVANGKVLFKVKPKKIRGIFNVKYKKAQDFVIYSKNKTERVRVIGVIDKSLITQSLISTLKVKNNQIMPDIKKDILKIAVVERYGHNNIANAFVKGFGLKRGAIASSVAHDSHNIIVMGTNNNDMAEAVNAVTEMRGGLVFVDKNIVKVELPIAGLMTTEKASIVSKKLEKLNNFAKKLGCKLASPFATLSFLALLPIPELKLSDKGLFDSKNFRFVPVMI